MNMFGDSVSMVSRLQYNLDLPICVFVSKTGQMRTLSIKTHVMFACGLCQVLQGVQHCVTEH